jgi:hypothetical protein
MKKSDVQREINSMTKNMSKYKTTILQVCIHREEVNPIFGEGNTYVSVDDEAAGPFLIIEQHDDDIEPGKVRMDYEEFLAVAEAAKMLMHQMYIEQSAQE